MATKTTDLTLDVQVQNITRSVGNSSVQLTVLGAADGDQPRGSVSVNLTGEAASLAGLEPGTAYTLTLTPTA